MTEANRVSKVSITVGLEGELVVLSKPENQQISQAYELETIFGGSTVWLNRERVEFPLTIIFTTSSSNEVITGLGFAEICNPHDLPTPPRCTEAGPCGACFTLEADTGGGEALVRDTGEEAPYGFAFELWVTAKVEGTERTLGHDPRIYNRGKLDHSWWRLLWLALRSLVAGRAHRRAHGSLASS